MHTVGQGSYGPRNTSDFATGEPQFVSADGLPEYKAGGITIDWSTVTAAAADTTLADGTFVASGKKALVRGTIMDQITVNAEVQTIDLSPGTDPTGGTFAIVFTDPLDANNTEQTADLAYNASAATVQAAVDAVSLLSAGDIVVTKVGFVYTLTYRGGLGNVPVVTVSNSLTGADTAPAVATGTAGNASGGKFGPADTTATDGRQTLANGETYVLNRTVHEDDYLADHSGGPFYGGKVFASRLMVGGVVGGIYPAAANQPTLANLLAACPRLQLVKD